MPLPDLIECSILSDFAHICRAGIEGDSWHLHFLPLDGAKMSDEHAHGLGGLKAERGASASPAAEWRGQKHSLRIPSPAHDPSSCTRRRRPLALPGAIYQHIPRYTLPAVHQMSTLGKKTLAAFDDLRSSGACTVPRHHIAFEHGQQHLAC